MTKADNKSRVIIVVLSISLFLVCLDLLDLFRKDTRVVFCDVGQGDATYMRVKNKADVLIDTGPNKKILDCLGKYMPFFDRTIEIVILSHPQKDHVGGIDDILKGYQVKDLFYNQIPPSNEAIKHLSYLIKLYKIPVHAASEGNNIRIESATISFLWPSPSQVAQLSSLSSKQINDLSNVAVFQENDVKIIFTGDISYYILERLFRQSNNKIYTPYVLTGKLKNPYTILKISHHGSKSGTSLDFLQLANIREGVISVGLKNSYGHPAGSVLDMLKAAGVKIRRTDLEGDIIFKIAP